MSKTPYIPDRGDIVWLVLDPRVGHEQSGRRPALVLSPKTFTEHTGLAVICPITSKIKGLPFEIIVKQTKSDGAILPIHIRSVDVVARKCSLIEKVSKTVLDRTEQSIKAMISPAT
jgi:mRNA interferase MazF